MTETTAVALVFVAAIILIAVGIYLDRSKSTATITVREGPFRSATITGYSAADTRKIVAAVRTEWAKQETLRRGSQ